MKAEERHRLHENELQRLAESARERSRPMLEQYGTAILIGIAAILLVIAAIVWWSKSSGASREAGWDDLAAAFRKPDATAEDFANVAELHPETSAAAWAKLYEGEMHLESGVQSLFADKDGAVRDLTDARVAFEQVLESKKLNPQMKVRALYGLARTLETTSDGNLQPALDAYEQIVKDYPDSVYDTLAHDRIDSLKSSDAKSFYAWFSKQESAPKDPISRPSDSGLLPGMSPFGGPGFGLPPQGDAAETASPDASGTTIEAPRPQATPAEATPAEATPAEATPAEATPAEATPAEATPAETTAATETPTDAAPEAPAAEETPSVEAEASATEEPATEDSAASEDAAPALPPQN